MILFCEDGSVVIVVSTGNMTNPRSTDGTWIQRFEPKGKSDATINNQAAKASKHETHSDFGGTLVNFLQCQSYATRPDDMIPEEFVKRYLDYKSLYSLEEKYQFDKAEVHLIATVPGEYDRGSKLEHNSEYDKQGKRTFLYGRQRVADIVARASLPKDIRSRKKSKRCPWCPETLLSNNDRVIIQPTSLGAFQQNDLSDVARYYLGWDDPIPKQRQKFDTHNNQKILDRTDIVWPSQRLITQIHRSFKEKCKWTKSPTSVVTNELEVTDWETMPFLFLCPENFNASAEPCLARMMM